MIWLSAFPSYLQLLPILPEGSARSEKSQSHKQGTWSFTPLNSQTLTIPEHLVVRPDRSGYQEENTAMLFLMRTHTRTSLEKSGEHSTCSILVQVFFFFAIHLLQYTVGDQAIRTVRFGHQIDFFLLL